ncbi:hypothetical protein BTUL_0027g00140 [Botrytis tulipae]|uniref:Uncharacterized protein n=1 Tax=Botrytis tulipae TaxID=87230 RepID=A0A4Z1EW13_9HELO|nr:hypothetical protein BTUL_0027g00140 [Botrytis tulipae]
MHETTNDKHGAHDFGAVEVFAFIRGKPMSVGTLEAKELGSANPVGGLDKLLNREHGGGFCVGSLRGGLCGVVDR